LRHQVELPKGGYMKMLQVYETTLMADTSAHEAHLVVIPSSSIPELRMKELLSNLELRKITDINPSNLNHALVSILPTCSVSIKNHWRNMNSEGWRNA
jgi:hypothetical protein